MLASKAVVLKSHHNILVRYSQYEDTGPTDPSLVKTDVKSPTHSQFPLKSLYGNVQLQVFDYDKNLLYWMFKLYVLCRISIISEITGPPENAMWSLGDKIASSIVAQTAGVPTLPWSGQGLTVDFSEEQLKDGKLMTVPTDIYK